MGGKKRVILSYRIIEISIKRRKEAGQWFHTALIPALNEAEVGGARATKKKKAKQKNRIFCIWIIKIVFLIFSIIIIYL